MSALIGSTGFVGSHLQKDFEFSHNFNSSNIAEIQNLRTDLLICAGLPAEKWKANTDPESDWSNMAKLAQYISSVFAEKAILISTIDVYQPAWEVTEDNKPNFDGEAAYGRNRAWFESFFTSQFPNTIVIRLPGLFGHGLKKNFIFDLMNKRRDLISNVHRDSEFQFYNIHGIWNLINLCIKNEIPLLNVATEPVKAQEIAGIFNFSLQESKEKVLYRMQSKHFDKFDGSNGFLHSKKEILESISEFGLSK